MSSQGKTSETMNLNDRPFIKELGAGAEFSAPVEEASNPLGTKWQWYWVWDNMFVTGTDRENRGAWWEKCYSCIQEGKPNYSVKLPVFLERMKPWLWHTSCLIHHKSILTCSVCVLVPSASLFDAVWILNVTCGHASKPITRIAS